MTRWLGHWWLLPELCHYSAGEVPAEADYRISREGALLRLDLRWIDGAGDVQEAGFAAPSDGTPVASGAADVDRFSVLAESDHALSGEAWFGDRRVGHAMRRVSADGTMMSVLQERNFAGGPQDRLFQVWRRVND